jgi:hypothetical protein
LWNGYLVWNNSFKASNKHFSFEEVGVFQRYANDSYYHASLLAATLAWSFFVSGCYIEEDAFFPPLFFLLTVEDSTDHDETAIIFFLVDENLAQFCAGNCFLFVILFEPGISNLKLIKFSGVPVFRKNSPGNDK